MLATVLLSSPAETPACLFVIPFPILREGLTVEPVVISNLIERHGSPYLILFSYCPLGGPGDLFFSPSDSKLMSAGAVYVHRDTAVREAPEGITAVDSLSVFTDVFSSTVH